MLGVLLTPNQVSAQIADKRIDAIQNVCEKMNSQIAEMAKGPEVFVDVCVRTCRQ